MNSAAIAGINARVLSLIAGFLFAYLMFQVSQEKKLESQIIQVASEVNLLRVGGTYGIGQGWGDYLVDLDSSRPKTLDSLGTLLMGFGHDETGEKLQSVEIGQRVTRIASRLSSAYPFPQIAGVSSQGGASIHRSNPTHIKFQSMADVTRWIASVTSLASHLRWIEYSYGDRLSVVLDAFRNSWLEGHLRQDDQERIRLLVEKADPTRRVRELMDNIEAAQQIANRLQPLLSAYHAVRETRPSTVQTIVMIAAATLGFLCGVLAPMWSEDAHRAVYLWIPTAIYVVMLFGLTWAVVAS